MKFRYQMPTCLGLDIHLWRITGLDDHSLLRSFSLLHSQVSQNFKEEASVGVCAEWWLCYAFLFILKDLGAKWCLYFTSKAIFVRQIM